MSVLRFRRITDPLLPRARQIVAQHPFKWGLKAKVFQLDRAEA
jgi:hypothetical protein